MEHFDDDAVDRFYTRRARGRSRYSRRMAEMLRQLDAKVLEMELEER